MRLKNLGLIACVDKNWAIGYQNDLLFHIREDMQRFRSMTTGNIVIMGRKTLESMPNRCPLPNRKNIILTSKPIDTDDIIVVRSINEILNIVSACHLTAYVIGGGQLYRTMLPTAPLLKLQRWNMFRQLPIVGFRRLMMILNGKLMMVKIVGRLTLWYRIDSYDITE